MDENNPNKTRIDDFSDDIEKFKNSSTTNWLKHIESLNEIKQKVEHMDSEYKKDILYLKEKLEVEKQDKLYLKEKLEVEMEEKLYLKEKLKLEKKKSSDTMKKLTEDIVNYKLQLERAEDDRVAAVRSSDEKCNNLKISLEKIVRRNLDVEKMSEDLTKGVIHIGQDLMETMELC